MKSYKADGAARAIEITDSQRTNNFHPLFRRHLSVGITQNLFDDFVFEYRRLVRRTLYSKFLGDILYDFRVEDTLPASKNTGDVIRPVSLNLCGNLVNVHLMIRRVSDVVLRLLQLRSWSSFLADEFDQRF